MQIARRGVSCVPGDMLKLRFATSQLSTSLSDKDRVEAFHRFLSSFYTHVELDHLKDHPLAVDLTAAVSGRFHLGVFDGSMERFARTRRAVASAPNDDFVIGINAGEAALEHTQAGRDVVLSSGGAVLCTNGEPGTVRAKYVNSWVFLGMPRQLLLDICPGAEHLLGREFSPDNPALRHLTQYAQFLLKTEQPHVDPSLTEHIDHTLADLISMMIGYEYSTLPLARLGGEQAGQLRELIRLIRANYRNADFALDDVARQLGVSARHVQYILKASGETFVERVLELRLQHARRLLISASHRTLKISDIAFMAGFGDVGHFNRQFRARFGITPSELRVGATG